jgi:nucleoid-associated protein EbfC
MFKEFGQLAGLLKNLPKMREEMEKLQSQLAQITAEGDAGAGMIKVKVNGQMELVKCTLTDEALKDREMLEDLLVAATNQALRKVKQQVAEQSTKTALGMSLPPELGTP